MDYLKIYNTLDSTNKEAQRLLASGPVNSGLTILTRQQTAGRGQYGRIWIAQPGSHLAMSLIYKPIALEAIALPTIGMKVSLAIIRAMKKIAPPLNPLIKWPNDIYIGQKKLCGMLIENALSGTRVQHSIIGIGMNINEAEFPPEIPNAISLLQATGTPYEVEKTALLIRKEILAILEETGSSWKNEYDHALYGLGLQYNFYADAEPFQAIVKGVSLQGHLILELPDGTIRSYANHELKWEMT
jgi:BirA family biotin operon repressor/biotin-[acetyl-CoA-carboxylase] ligase